MYGDWRDVPVSNGNANVMLNCRTINPRTKLASVIRYLKSTDRFYQACAALYFSGLTNIIYAQKAVRDLQ